MPDRDQAQSTVAAPQSLEKLALRLQLAEARVVQLEAQVANMAQRLQYVGNLAEFLWKLR
jgi:hypothetical protein